MKKKILILLSLTLLGGTIFSQGYVIRRANWQEAGYRGIKPVFTATVNILAFGGDNTGTVSNNAALNSAIASLGGQPGVIYFPAGTFLFSSTVSVNRDSIVFRGAGYDSTTIKFSMGGVLNNCFNVYGSQLNADTTRCVQDATRDSFSVNVFNAVPFSANDWVYLQTNDSSVMYSSWAYGSLGQILQLQSVSGSRLTFKSPFRYNYNLSLQPRIKRIIPRNNIGFECMKLQRMDVTTFQTSIITFDRAVNCWVNGIESDSANFGHVEINRSSNIEITNSFFHHGHSYGSGGEAYGIIFQFSSGECRAEGNVFMHLRHSLLFQAGSNGNVCGYNYSFDPYWNEGFFPANSAGELVLHGNFPFANLFEGNYCQNIVVDDSHAKNGPWNTFFRNRAELYGIFMNSNPPTDSVQFFGNEVTNASLGFYNLAGNGHVQYGNNIKGTITPAGTGNLTDTSLYLFNGNRPLCMATGYSWPAIGMPNVYNTGSIEARDRYLAGIPAQCGCTSISTSLEKNSTDSTAITVWPNPCQAILHISSHREKLRSASVFDLNGRLLKTEKLSGRKEEMDMSALAAGFYFLRLESTAGSAVFRIIRTN